jgi:hypothetical protein
MGTFIYDTPSNHVELDDRTLMHLRIVVMNKLRRSEPFMFDVQMHDGSGHRSYWLHPGVPLQFVFFSNHAMHINRLWIEALMESASGPNGLTIVPEPDESAESAPAPVRTITSRTA